MRPLHMRWLKMDNVAGDEQLNNSHGHERENIRGREMWKSFVILSDKLRCLAKGFMGRWKGHNWQRWEQFCLVVDSRMWPSKHVLVLEKPAKLKSCNRSILPCCSDSSLGPVILCNHKGIIKTINFYYQTTINILVIVCPSKVSGIVAKLKNTIRSDAKSKLCPILLLEFHETGAA